MNAGVVLAGGAGSRMGGATKALLMWRGRPLIAWVLDAMAPHVDEILVLAGPRAPELRALRGVRVLADEGAGPHAALAAAARATRRETLLVAPADSPRLTPAVYAALLLAAREDGAIAQEGAFENPLVGAYRRDALARALVGAKGPREATARLRLARVPIEAALLADVDAPEDLD